MDYNYNFFNAYSDPYYTLTTLLDNTKPAFHNFNQPSILNWSYSNHHMPQSQFMHKTGAIIISTLHRVSRNTASLSHSINQPYQHRSFL